MTDKIERDLKSDQEGLDSSDNSASNSSASRRRLLKIAVKSAPVVLTVSSRPVWARNCTLSGQLSGNLSDQGGGGVCAGEGCTPGYWKNHPQSWHMSAQPELLFDSVFGTNVFPNLSLGQVIGLCGNTQISQADINIVCSKCHNLMIMLGFHAVAALQNAATAVQYDLTVEEVIAGVRSAYQSRSKYQIEAMKDRLDTLNNQYCPGGGGAACGNKFKII